MDYGTPNTLLGRLPNMRFLSGIKKSQRKNRRVRPRNNNTPTKLFHCFIFMYKQNIYLYNIYIIYTILYTIYYSIILYYGRYEKKGGFWNKKSCSVLLCIVQFTFLSSFLLNKFCFSPLPLCSIGKLWILFKLKSNYCISEKSLF